MGKCVAAVETHGLANDALPTTKQQLVTDIRKPIWTGKIKKPCIYKQITGLLRHSWTGKKTIRYFVLVPAFARLILLSSPLLG